MFYLFFFNSFPHLPLLYIFLSVMWNGRKLHFLFHIFMFAEIILPRSISTFSCNTYFRVIWCCYFDTNQPDKRCPDACNNNFGAFALLLRFALSPSLVGKSLFSHHQVPCEAFLTLLYANANLGYKKRRANFPSPISYIQQQGRIKRRLLACSLRWPSRGGWGRQASVEPRGCLAKPTPRIHGRPAQLLTPYTQPASGTFKTATCLPGAGFRGGTPRSNSVRSPFRKPTPAEPFLPAALQQLYSDFSKQGGCVSFWPPQPAARPRLSPVSSDKRGGSQLPLPRGGHSPSQLHRSGTGGWQLPELCCAELSRRLLGSGRFSFSLPRLLPAGYFRLSYAPAAGVRPALLVGRHPYSWQIPPLASWGGRDPPYSVALRELRWGASVSCRLSPDAPFPAVRRVSGPSPLIPSQRLLGTAWQGAPDLRGGVGAWGEAAITPSDRTPFTDRSGRCWRGTGESRLDTGFCDSSVVLVLWGGAAPRPH